MKNAFAFEPERSPGISEAIKNPETGFLEKAIINIEGIRKVFLNPVIP